MLSFVILTADDKSRTSAAIQLATRSRYSHAALAFSAHGCDWPCVYYECIGQTSSGSRVGGARGPLPLSGLTLWGAHDPEARRAIVAPLPIEPHTSLLTRERADFFVGRTPYARLDLVRIAAALGSGWWLSRARGATRACTCAEFVARCLPLDVAAPLLHLGRYTFDAIIPAGHRLPSWRDALPNWTALFE